VEEREPASPRSSEKPLGVINVGLAIRDH